jgi:hypothetical protein
MSATEPSNLTLDAALLMRAADAGQTEERLEPIVRTHHGEPVRLDTIPPAQHLGHRCFQVVVADPDRDAAEVFERSDVTIEEHLLGLVEVGDRERPPRRRQTHHEHRDLGQHATQVDVDRPEVDFALVTQRVMLRDSNIDQRCLLAFPNDLDVAAHSRLAQIGVVLVNEALPHPPSGVTLLAWQRPIRFEPGVDDRFEPVHLRRRPLR